MQSASSVCGPLRGASLGRPLPCRLSARRRPSSSRIVTHAGLFSKGGGEKEDAARKALQDAFTGKKDPFAAAEERAKKRGGGGSSGGGSGGGGSGGSGGGFSFNEFGDSFRKGASSFFKTVATILLFAATLFVLTLWRPLLAFLTALVRTLLRLDGNPRAQMARSEAAPQVDLSKKDGLGNVEEAVLSKYAAADDDDEGGTESEGEEA